MSPVIIPETATAISPTQFVTIPHFAFPMRMLSVQGQIQAAVNEQDSLEDVFACVRVIASCPVGSDPNDPSFGIPNPAFGSVPVDPSGIQQALFRQEPRAVTVAQEFPDATSDAFRHVLIDVSTQQTDR